MLTQVRNAVGGVYDMLIGAPYISVLERSKSWLVPRFRPRACGALPHQRR